MAGTDGLKQLQLAESSVWRHFRGKHSQPQRLLGDLTITTDFHFFVQDRVWVSGNYQLNNSNPNENVYKVLI